MPKQLLREAFSALPTYFGGKRSHIRWLFKSLSKSLPQSHWPELNFVDAFMGGGSVTMAAKACGFQKVYCNDYSERSQFIAQGLLVNQRHTITHSNLLWLLQNLPDTQYSGLIANTYCPSVFSQRHAQLLDQMLYWANQLHNPTKRAQAHLLVWHCALNFVCFATSLGTSNRPYAEAQNGLRSWDSLNPKRLVDGSIERLLKPNLDIVKAKVKIINRGVFSGSSVIASQLDALEFLKQVQGDVVYWDPPYAGTLQYEKSYAVLDHLLTGKEASRSVSSFSSSTDVLNTLLDASQHISTWMLSYGNKEIELPELIALVERHAGKRKVQGYAKQCKHLAHVSKNQNNQELLIIACPEQEIIRRVY